MPRQSRLDVRPACPGLAGPRPSASLHPPASRCKALRTDGVIGDVHAERALPMQSLHERPLLYKNVV